MPLDARLMDRGMSKAGVSQHSWALPWRPTPVGCKVPGCARGAAARGIDRGLVTSTFTIVATDGSDLGIGVASRVLAVGAIVPAVEIGSGAVATQAFVNVAWKGEGLRLLREGRSAAAVVEALRAPEPTPDGRQVAVVDRAGRTAAHTGSGCTPWAGHREGPGFVVIGNILAGERVVEAMSEAFVSSSGELATRLVAALQAGDRVGGDARGRQSAAMVVERRHGGIDGLDNRLLDLRVDDAPDPVTALAQLVSLGVAEYRTRQVEG